MRTRLQATLLALLLIIVGVLGTKARAQAGDESVCRVIVASDLHYISPAICDFGAYFTHMMDNSDSKLTQYCVELTETFLDEVIAQKPAALLLTGDLSFNGARESHADLAERLRRVEAAGIPVLVLTGNHDVYNRNAARFEGDSFTRLTPCTSEDFLNVYADFGPDEALSADADSLSYLCALDENTWALMFDFNTAHDFCGVSEATLRWTEEQLRRAEGEEKLVIAAGHQNLFVHSAFVYGYVIDRAQQLSTLLREYRVPLFLSGHLHIQHGKTEEGLTEITTSALSVFPCQYGIVTAERGRIHYETKRVDVPAWAAAHGLSESLLANFPTYAEQVMDMRTGRETEGELTALGYSAEERAEMLAYARTLNKAYFSGNLTEAASWDPDGHISALWASTGTLWDYYMRTVIPDFGHDYTRWDWEYD